jgi:hypothetical protein
VVIARQIDNFEGFLITLPAFFNENMEQGLFAIVQGFGIETKCIMLGKLISASLQESIHGMALVNGLKYSLSVEIEAMLQAKNSKSVDFRCLEGFTNTMLEFGRQVVIEGEEEKKA